MSVADAASEPGRAHARRRGRAAVLLGLAFGGFFDGILLHQILAWHHLLSSFSGGVFDDLGTQLLADGLFHALMFVVAAVGLAMLIRAGPRAAGPTPADAGGRRFAAVFLLGFGAWHVIDAVFSHWILGIHRIRTDAGPPLWWDLGWLAVFGLLPIAIGVVLRRRSAPGDDGGDASVRRGVAAATPGVLAALTVVAAVFAARPAAGVDAGTVAVITRDDGGAAALFAALSAIDDARIVGSDPGGRVWLLQLPTDASRAGLYRAGAIVLGGTLVPAGCAAWLRG